MNNKYYLGVDGGGTKTSFVIIDDNNNVVYKKIVGPTAMDTVSIDKIKAEFYEGTKDFKYKVNSVFAGVGGTYNVDQLNTLKDIISKLDICDINTKIAAGNDVVNALYGGLGGKDGIIIIAGTGSVCFGKNGNKSARSGGYCYREGDAGSAYYLGTLALQYLARALDGRKRKTKFANMLIDESGCYDFSTLADFITNASRTKIASLAKIVTKCDDDVYAKEIIKKAVDEMLLMIKAVYKRLKFDNDVVYFTIIGSLGNANTLYKKLLLENLHKISPTIKYIDKCYEADFGSALKAKELSNNNKINTETGF